MSPAREDLLDVAAQIADDTLFVHALEVDAAARIPDGHFAALAQAGLFGIAGPREAGGLDLDLRAQRRVREMLAGGCLTTAFVWTQHQGVVRRLRDAPAQIREAWLPDLCAGRRLGGLVLAGLLPGPPQLRAEPSSDGFTISGSAPAVSGWGYADTLLVVARHEPAGTVVYALVDCGAAGLRARPRELAALNGTRTVELHFDAVRVEAPGVVDEQPLPAWAAAGEGVRANGSFAIGIAGRCARLCGELSLRAAIDRCRDALDTAADGDELARARAGAALLAARASAYLVADRGSSAFDTREHAQRLAREALFLLAFGQRPAIKDALLDRLRLAERAAQIP